MDIQFNYIGWCKETEPNGSEHDKIWTAFECEGKYFAGWGRRGKKISFKQHGTLFSLNTVQRKKQKTYKEVDQFQLFALFPTFKEDVGKFLTFDLLAGKVM